MTELEETIKIRKKIIGYIKEDKSVLETNSVQEAISLINSISFPEIEFITTKAINPKRIVKIARQDLTTLFPHLNKNVLYIPKKDIETLHTQVKDYEPYNALEGGEDGLDFYRQITEESVKYLKQDGILAYEVGHDQAEDVSKIMKHHGYDRIYTKKDIQGIDRVVIGFKL